MTLYIYVCMQQTPIYNRLHAGDHCLDLVVVSLAKNIYNTAYFTTYFV